MKKSIALLLALCLALSLTACGSAAPKATDAPATDAPATDAPVEAKVYKIGICQLLQHEALDAATLGFREKLTELLGEGNVTFDEQNAQGDVQTCSTICNQFVADEVDLILANATPALQAAASATGVIPILGTSVTDYPTALNLDDVSNGTGLNISGTCDLAPLDQQAELLLELFPETKSVGILYCSAEPNSVYQAKVFSEIMAGKGVDCADYTFADTNDVAAVTAVACEGSDVLFVPTDNVAASNAELISSVAVPAGTPIIAGESGICAGCGVATLSISYYDIGAAAAEMAADILLNGADVSTMPIGSAPVATKKFNAELCAQMGVEVPEGAELVG